MQMYIRMQQKCKAQLAGSVVVYEFEIWDVLKFASRWSDVAADVQAVTSAEIFRSAIEQQEIIQLEKSERSGK